MYYNSIEDGCWSIKHIIKDNLFKNQDSMEERPIVTLSNKEAHDILEAIDEIENDYEDISSDYDFKDEEVDVLNNRISDLEFYEDIPDELATLLKQPNIDVGTVIELKETITKILKERGYNV